MEAGGGSPTAREDHLRQQAMERLKVKRELRGNIASFVVINAALWVVWAVSSGESEAGGVPWPLWVTGFWGVALVLHAWNVYGQRPISDSEVDEEMRRIRGA
jgi:hypothetical protein